MLKSILKIMAYKKKPQNKSEKATTESKAPKASKPAAPKKVDWSSLPAEVYIVGLKGKHLAEGQEYKVIKETAQILVEKGAAKLK